jgi:hypothetical protein
MRADHSDQHPQAEEDPCIHAVKENPFVYVVIAMCFILVVFGFIFNWVPMWACGLVALVVSSYIACGLANRVR